jgi:hypothetical protein
MDTGDPASRPAPGSCQRLKLTISRAITGTASMVSTQEISSAAAIVTDSALANAPVTPERRLSGMNTMMVARLEPDCGERNSRAAGNTAALPRAAAGSPAEWSIAPARRAMCSIITITSSISRPTAAAMPPRVMMLKLNPITESIRTVMSSVTGTTMMATSVTRQLRRNSSMTRPARSKPIATASRTLPSDSVTNWLWSYQRATLAPGGI